MPAGEIGRVVSDGETGSDTPRSLHQRLPSFIAENIEPIVGEWETFARTLTPSATGMTSLALRDHIHQILEFIIQDILSEQTSKEETLKSHGKKHRSLDNTAAETHAALRLAGGFNIGQMTSEYRALRASVTKLWERKNSFIDAKDFKDFMRFHESIDQVLTESVSYYAEGIFRSKDLFVGILGHDLRNPIHSIMLSADLLLRIGTLSDKQTMLSKNIIDCAERITTLTKTLLDVTRARFGGGLSIVRGAMNMGFVGHQIVEEIRNGNPSRTIELETSENLDGEWDRTRLGQAISNLLGNAIQYGFKDPPIKVSIIGDLESVTLTVHNQGKPISKEKIGVIFNPLTRAMTGSQSDTVTTNLGLGLYITEEIVLAHGGNIKVSSSEKEGTTFTARFPRAKSTRNLRLA